MRSALAPDIARLAAERGGARTARRARRGRRARCASAPATCRRCRSWRCEFWSALVDASDNVAYRLAYNSLRATYDQCRELLTQVLADEIGDVAGYRAIAAAVRTRRRRARGAPGARADRARRARRAAPARPLVAALGGRTARRPHPAPPPTRAERSSLTASDSPRTLGEALRVLPATTGSPRIVSWRCWPPIAARVWRSATGRCGTSRSCSALVAYWPLQEWLIHVFILHFRPITRVRPHARLPRAAQAPRASSRAVEASTSCSSRCTRSSTRCRCIVALWFAPDADAAARAHRHRRALRADAALRVGALPGAHPLPADPALYQRLWRNHRLHHFKNEHYWFGVTMLSGDRLLRHRAGARRRRRPRRPAARSASRTGSTAARARPERAASLDPALPVSVSD